MERRGLVEHLRRIGYRELEAPPVGAGEFACGPGEIAIGRRPFALVDGGIDSDLLVVELDRRGRIRRLRSEAGRLEHTWIEPEVIGVFYGARWMDRRPLPLDAYPQHLIDALLAMEDRRFRHHVGLDPWRIAGAALANLRAGRVTQGGSTRTQPGARAREGESRARPPRGMGMRRRARALPRRERSDGVLRRTGLRRLAALALLSLLPTWQPLG